MATGQGNLVTRAQFALGLSQNDLAQKLGVNKRTVGRWQGERTTMVPVDLERIAALVHPVDRALAAELATAAGSTSVTLGLEAAPPAPTLAHLVDSIVCVAAEAVDSTPKAVRPILLAAFERASALGLGVSEVHAVLRTPGTPPGSKKKPPA